MKYQDIITTATGFINGYISNGWIFDPEIMRGSQSNVDFMVTLTDGTDSIAIYISSYMESTGCVKLNIEKFNGVGFHKLGERKTLWCDSNKDEIISSFEFYRVRYNADWYVSKDEYEAAKKVRESRRDGVDGWYKLVFESETDKEVAFKVMKKKPGFKRIKLDNIFDIRKVVRNGKAICYEIYTIKDNGKQEKTVFNF